MDHILKKMADALDGKSKTKSELARRLNLAPARIHEILRGERRIQMHEWPIIQDYLELGEDGLDPNAARTIISSDPEDIKLLAAALEPILAAYGAPAEDAQEIAAILGEVVQALRDAKGGALDPSDYYKAGRIAARPFSRQAG